MDKEVDEHVVDKHHVDKPPLATKASRKTKHDIELVKLCYETCIIVLL